jgi:hypothetical protein
MIDTNNLDKPLNIVDSNDINEEDIPSELPLEQSEVLYLSSILNNYDMQRSTMDSTNIINQIVENNNNIDRVCNNIFYAPKATIELEENEDKNQNPKCVTLNLKKYTKRGRKKEEGKPIRKKHSSMDDDNVLTKIQVHFFTYLINITNDIIKSGFGKNGDFQQIKYDDKKNIKLDNIKKLKNSKIKDILQMKISSKCRKYDENYNKNNYIKILEAISIDTSLNWITDFFHMNYLDLFEKYYNNDNSFFGKEINISKETKSFNDLLKKNDDKMKECLNIISKRYLQGIKPPSPHIFNIHKND